MNFFIDEKILCFYIKLYAFLIILKFSSDQSSLDSLKQLSKMDRKNIIKPS